MAKLHNGHEVTKNVHSTLGSSGDNNKFHFKLLAFVCVKWILFETFRGNVTGPPGALLFDVNQRSHEKNHYNCSFRQLAAWGIYCTVLL